MALATKDVESGWPWRNALIKAVCHPGLARPKSNQSAACGERRRMPSWPAAVVAPATAARHALRCMAWALMLASVPWVGAGVSGVGVGSVPGSAGSVGVHGVNARTGVRKENRTGAAGVRGAGGASGVRGCASAGAQRRQQQQHRRMGNMAGVGGRVGAGVGGRVAAGLCRNGYGNCCCD